MRDQEARTLVLLEEFSAAEDALKMSSRGTASATYVALTPAAMVGLEQLLIPYRIPTEFVSSQEIQRAITAHRSLYDDFARILGGLHPAAIVYVPLLRTFWDSCFEKIFQIERIIGTLRPNSIIAQTRSTALPRDQLGFAESECLYGELVPWVLARIAPQTKCCLQSIHTSGSRSREELLRLRRRAARWWRWVRSFREIWRNSRRPRNLSKPHVCVVQRQYQVGEITAALGDVANVAFWDPSGEFGPSDLTKRELLAWRGERRRAEASGQVISHPQSERALAECRDLMHVRGVDIFPLVESRLRRLFFNRIPELPRAEAAAAAYLKRRGTACVVSCFFAESATCALATAARSLSIPVVTVQHSLYGCWDWTRTKWSDSIFSDYKLVGGAEVAAFVRDLEGTRCQPVPTGLPEADALLARSGRLVRPARHRPLVVYPLASYLKNAIYYDSSRLALTEYFSINQRVLEILGRHDGMDVVVRPHPASDFREQVRALEQWVHGKGWSHVTFRPEGESFAIMGAADLVVIDSPSTILLHAVLTDARIVAYNGIFNFTETGLRLLQKRITITNSIEEFLRRLQEMLERRDFDNSAFRNQEFAEAYAITGVPGQAQQRATEFLRTVVTNA
jgi:hypothetical protein